MSLKLKSLLSRGKKDPPELHEPTIDQTNLARSSSDDQNYGLQLLYDGADADHPDVDFVAVHGIGGHPLRSFTNAETGCCWLRDLLPSTFPRCRVFSYGYRVELFAKAQKSLSDLARELCWSLWLSSREQTMGRRRIFICHSYGGILVKLVLIEARSNSRLVNVYKYTSGILFLGTPHRGVSASFLVTITRLDPGARRTNQALLRDLEHNSSRMNEINEAFTHVAANSLSIVSFYETQATKPFGIVVDRSSAILNWSSELCLSLDANHAQLLSNVIDHLRETALLSDTPLTKSTASLSVTPSRESLSQWIPCIASKKGLSSMGLLEMAGSMEQPKDYLDAEMDIIAVHGLRGSPIRSWTNRSPQTMWLRDMLQVDIPTSRVMSYGYRTEDVLRQNRFNLDRFARDLVDSIVDARAGIPNTSRPLMFIGYSFGGLLVKKALLHLRDNEQQLGPEIKKLLQAVICVIFLGVPHDINDPSFVHRWTGIVQCTAGMKRIEILNAAGSIDEIRQISTHFRGLGDLEVCSIAESEPTKVLQTQEKTVLVSAKSSRLAWEERETIFVAKGKNHLELPIFVDRDDPAYVCIRDFVSRNLDRHGREFGRGERQQFLDALRQVDYAQIFESIAEPYPGTCETIFHTEPSQSWLAKPRGILLVQGFPGSGKSVLAKHLVRQIPEAFQPRATRVLYYFVHREFPKDTCEIIMSSLLHQLLKEPGSPIQYAVGYFRALGEDFVGSLDVLTRIFTSIISQEQEISFIVIIDALDELSSGERTKLVNLSSQLENIPNLGCIMTSRNIPDLISFAVMQHVTLNLREPGDLRPEMEKFVSGSLETLHYKRFLGLEFAELQAIKRLIVERATNSFLWAYLAVGSFLLLVGEGARFFEVIDELNQLPLELKLLYDNLVNKIVRARTPHELSEYRQILSILAVQQESMHLSVLVEALQGLSPQKLSSKRVGDVEDHYIHDLDVKISALMPLVVSRNGYITLAHQSLREYLLDREDLKFSSLASIDFNQASADLARRCVAVIHRSLTAKARPEDLKKLGHSFTGYAAKNWMIHFHLANKLVDEELIESASGLFRTDESPVSPWLMLYEEATSEKLPRRQIFGPLFGGAYFGLTAIVKKALEVGCDINAVDSNAKTPLHWASERGYVEVAILLILNGADIFSQAFDGRTSLHFAAQNCHIDLVKQLLASGISPDSAAFDGRTALHLAVEANHIEMVEILLDAGADATARTTSGLNAFQFASQLTTQRVLHLLMNSATVPEKLLSKAITENTPDMVALLITQRLDVIESQYPWVVELVDEGLSAEEISSLLLKSENLQWIDSEKWPPRSKLVWNDLLPLRHQRGCAHQHVHTVFESPGPSPSDSVTEQQNEQFRSSKMSSSHLSEDNSILILPDAFLEPVEFFARLEQREQDLLQSCGIGGVFPPWYAALNPGFAILLASQAKIMYGEPDSAQIFFPITTIAHPYTLPIEASEHLHAGSNDDVDMVGFDVSSYVESASIFSNLTETSKQTDPDYDSLSSASSYEIWDRKIGRRILDALENVLNALHLLHGDDGCCESFTILVKASSRHRTIMVRSIAVSLLLKLCEALEQSTLAEDTDTSSWTQPLARACTTFFQELGFGEIVHKYLQSSLGNAVSPHRCLHLCALVTQMAAIGIVTYSRGHSREFYTPALSRPIESFVLLGSDPAGPTLNAERLNLKCMGKMLGRRVWVFHQEKHLIGNTADTFYLATSVEDMLDTWGGSISVEDVVEPAALFLSVGGGSIVAVEPNDGVFDMAQDGELCCHWTPGWVCATGVNDKCLLKAEVCQEAFSGGALTSMGTRAPRWRTTGRGANLGIGFYGASVGVAGTQTKDDGRSLKVKIFQDWDRTTDLRILNHPCGLELSLCTGIARRLPLRELFYGEVLNYLRLGLPGEWTKIQSIVTDIPGQSEEGFGEWLSKLTDIQTEVMQKATVLLLLAMEYTGVERDGHTLTFWWPEKLEATPRGLQIKKEQYSGKNPWIHMFQDPERCVIFGLASPRCLEHDGVKMCQNTTTPATCTEVKEVMLETSLISATPLINAVPLSYDLNKRFVLWYCRHILRVTRASEATDDVVRLNFVPGTPYIVMQRLIERWEKVKEKETLGDKGQNVLVL
ncbi:hypothetical protein MMC11_007595 [Xylographa trunciseda]|nr:hypothetical protein [Xylographa trunciseda]